MNDEIEVAAEPSVEPESAEETAPIAEEAVSEPAA